MPIAGCMTPVLGCVQTRVDLIRTAQANYPERLGLAVVCNPPFLFWALWRSVSPFLDAVTKCAPPCQPALHAAPTLSCVLCSGSFTYLQELGSACVLEAGVFLPA